MQLDKAQTAGTPVMSLLVGAWAVLVDSHAQL